MHRHLRGSCSKHFMIRSTSSASKKLASFFFTEGGEAVSAGLNLTSPSFMACAKMLWINRWCSTIVLGERPSPVFLFCPF